MSAVRSSAIEKNEHGECIKGPASWMCNKVDATEVGGSENTNCRQRIEWLKHWGMHKFEAKHKSLASFSGRATGCPLQGLGVESRLVSSFRLASSSSQLVRTRW